ncbi:unnamed protein product [Pedinophyceae sp. YPF-701]|nr:unnamed protein product [Pedinophyceae sp. YPF-701]
MATKAKLPPPSEGLVDMRREHVPTGGRENFRVFEALGSDGVLSVEPAVVLFEGFTARKTARRKIRIVNTSKRGTRYVMHAPPPESNFKVSLASKKGRLAPGMADEIEITFHSDKYEDYTDMIGLECEGTNIAIPLHAFPAPPDLSKQVPRTIDFGLCAAGRSYTRSITLRSGPGPSHAFEVLCANPTPEITIEPSSGIIPGDDSTYIMVTYTPATLATASCDIDILVPSHRGAKPVPCRIFGSGAPGAAREEALEGITGTRQPTAALSLASLEGRDQLDEPLVPPGGGAGGGDAYTRMVYSRTQRRSFLKSQSARGGVAGIKLKPLVQKPREPGVEWQGTTVTHATLKPGAIGEVNQLLMERPGRLTLRSLHEAVEEKQRQHMAFAKRLDNLAGGDGLSRAGSGRALSREQSNDFAPKQPGMRNFAALKRASALDDPGLDHMMKAELFEKMFEESLELVRFKDLRGGTANIGERLMTDFEDDLFAKRVAEMEHVAEERQRDMALARNKPATSGEPALWLIDGAPLTQEEVNPGTEPSAPPSKSKRSKSPSKKDRSGPAPYVPSFTPYENDSWNMRCLVVDRFKAAVRRAIYRYRAGRRLQRLNKFLDGAGRNREQVAKIGEKMLKMAGEEAVGAAVQIDLREALKDTTVMPSVLPSFRHRKFQGRAEPVGLMQPADWDELPVLDLMVPTRYKLMGYTQVPFETCVDYMDRALDQPLLQGAEEEASSRVVPAATPPAAPEGETAAPPALPPIPSHALDPGFSHLHFGSKYAESVALCRPAAVYGVDRERPLPVRQYDFEDLSMDHTSSNALDALDSFGFPLLHARYTPTLHAYSQPERKPVRVDPADPDSPALPCVPLVHAPDIMATAQRRALMAHHADDWRALHAGRGPHRAPAHLARLRTMLSHAAGLHHAPSSMEPSPEPSTRRVGGRVSPAPSAVSQVHGSVAGRQRSGAVWYDLCGDALMTVPELLTRPEPEDALPDQDTTDMPELEIVAPTDEDVGRFMPGGQDPVPEGEGEKDGGEGGEEEEEEEREEELVGREAAEAEVEKEAQERRHVLGERVAHPVADYNGKLQRPCFSAIQGVM